MERSRDREIKEMQGKFDATDCKIVLHDNPNRSEIFLERDGAHVFLSLTSLSLLEDDVGPTETSSIFSYNIARAMARHRLMQQYGPLFAGYMAMYPEAIDQLSLDEALCADVVDQVSEVWTLDDVSARALTLYTDQLRRMNVYLKESDNISPTVEVMLPPLFASMKRNKVYSFGDLDAKMRSSVNQMLVPEEVGKIELLTNWLANISPLDGNPDHALDCLNAAISQFYTQIDCHQPLHVAYNPDEGYCFKPRK